MSRAAIAAAALALVPLSGCAIMAPPAGRSVREQPITHRAVDVLALYAATLEAATPLVAAPHTPEALVQALVRAERLATPAAVALGAALRAHLAAPNDQSAQALDQALARAAPPVSAFAGILPVETR